MPHTQAEPAATAKLLRSGPQRNPHGSLCLYSSFPRISPGILSQTCGRSTSPTLESLSVPPAQKIRGLHVLCTFCLPVSHHDGWNLSSQSQPRQRERWTAPAIVWHCSLAHGQLAILRIYSNCAACFESLLHKSRLDHISSPAVRNSWDSAP